LERFPYWERSVLDSVMNIHYEHNDNFIIDSTQFSISHKVSSINSRMFIESREKNFAAFFSISQPFTQEDSILYSKHIFNTQFENILDFDRVNKEHIFIAKDIIFTAYGESNVVNWKDYVNFLSDLDSKNKFNADTAFYISLPEIKFYSNYTHCKVLVIHKQGRGCFRIFFLYREDAKEKLFENITAIEQSFRFGNENPAKKKLENPTIVEVLAIPKQQKSQLIK